MPRYSSPALASLAPKRKQRTLRALASAWRRPFVTHFTGCNPCGGRPNEIYSTESCAEGMRRALNLADDQVLRAYGFRHAGPLKDDVRPLVA